MNKDKITAYCRIAAAVAILALFLTYAENYFLRYLIFAFVTALAGVKLSKKDLKLSNAPLCVALFLILTIAVSYIEPASAQAEITVSGVLCTVLLTPIFEELFFRAAMRKLPFYEITSALIFALFHPSALLQCFALGLALALFYKRTASLAVPIVCHMANNVLAFICIYKDVRIPALSAAVIAAGIVIWRKNEKKVL